MKYEIRITQQYRKAFKRHVRSGSFPLDKLNHIINLLAAGESLPTKYRNHRLTGQLKEFQECHILPGLLLIYQIFDDQLVLVLVNIGNHSSVFNR